MVVSNSGNHFFFKTAQNIKGGADRILLGRGTRTKQNISTDFIHIQIYTGWSKKLNIPAEVREQNKV